MICQATNRLTMKSATWRPVMSTDLSAPAGYGLDVGVMDDRRTDMVEVNDGWGSLWLYKGTYSPLEYLQPVETRWMEMVAHG